MPRAKIAAANPFREGCDARYAGKSIALCPYSFNTTAADAWRDGWKRVDETIAKQEPRR